MKLKIIVVFLSIIQLSFFACSRNEKKEVHQIFEIGGVVKNENQIEVGAERINEYLPFLEKKQVALVVNQTSMVGERHLADTLFNMGVNIRKIFSPEHGFRGIADAGEYISDGKDPETGIPVVSLYGKKKKPDKEDLANIDVVVFDIQDVGARFYTYISTLHYIMEACAENDIDLMVLDRPNPNGHYLDGPILENSHRSFVGMHSVPVVHGMTIGEYAKMINNEGWLEKGIKCMLRVIPCQNYDHTIFYNLPVKPSPNLPNMRAIYLYPSLCFFEGTIVSVGRGTEKQFQVFGAPDYETGNYVFTPKPMPGAKYPKHEGIDCHGYDLTVLELDSLRKMRRIDLSFLIDYYQNSRDKESFFLENLYFDKLAGGTRLRQKIIAGEREKAIRKSWEPELEKFKKIRKKYLLYPDFE